MLIGDPSDDELLNTIFTDIAQLIDMEKFYHYRPSEALCLLRLHLSGGITEKERTMFATIGFGESLCGRVAERRKRIIVEDLQHSSQPGSDVLRDSGATSYVGFPLVANGELIGTIAFISKRRTYLREGDIQMIQTICDQIATALERTKFERELRESEERFKVIADSAPVLVWMNGLEGADFVNRAYLDFVGVSGQIDVAKYNWAASVHPDDREGYIRTYLHAVEERVLFDEQFRFRRHDGCYRWMRVVGQPRFSSDGELLGYVGATYDVTEIKEAQERLERWAVELEQAVNVKTAELHESHARLRAMSTELNLAEQRERKRLATELHDHLQQMLVFGKLTIGQGKRAAAAVPACELVLKKLDDIFSNALAYTRTLVAELSPPVLQEHGLAAGLKWLGEYMKRRDQTVTVIVPDENNLKMPEDHKVLLFQSVRELLINSAKHAGTGQATVTMAARDGHLTISVRDEGVGFDLAAATATETPSGGLSSKYGLFSVEERMRTLGGSFDIRSAPRQGTTATLSVPLPGCGKSTARRAVSPNTHSAGVRMQPESKRKGKKSVQVLLVDDHEMIRQGLRAVLESYDDVTIVGEAVNGEEAVAAVEKLRPQIVVMDINMPKMNGIEATGRIKQRYPETVVIGLSVNTAEDNQEAMRRAGAGRLMNKEAAVEQLYDAIQEACNPGRPKVP